MPMAQEHFKFCCVTSANISLTKATPHIHGQSQWAGKKNYLSYEGIQATAKSHGGVVLWTEHLCFPQIYMLKT